MSTIHDIGLLAGRLLLSALFVNSAIDKFRLDPADLRQIRSLGLPWPELIARLTGVFEIAGVAALVLGVYARTAALALAAFVTVVSLLFVRFWSFDGPPEIKPLVRNLFFGNAALIGGLLYVAIVGPGAIALIQL